MSVKYAGKDGDAILIDCTTWCGWTQKHTTQRHRAPVIQRRAASGRKVHIICPETGDYPSATIADSVQGFSELAKRFKWRGSGDA